MERRRALIATGALLIVVAVATAAWTLWRAARHAAETALLTPREETVDVGVLVTRVRELNRLETASMHVVHVGTISQSYNLVPNALAGDAITLYSAGDVIAGLDLAQLRADDAWREPDGTVVLRLPEAQILVSRIDNRETRVIARKTGVFRRADPQLEGRARQFAEQSIRREAMNRGILSLAQQNGEKRLADLLHTLGARRVRFLTRAASPLPR